MNAGCVYVFMGTYQPMQPTKEEYIHGTVSELAAGPMMTSLQDHVCCMSDSASRRLSQL